MVDGDNGRDYKKTLEVYYKCIFEGRKKGAILVSVCRGRLSEGVDFCDDAARLVLMVGMPFAQQDHKVKLKMKKLGKVGGDLWYR